MGPLIVNKNPEPLGQQDLIRQVGDKLRACVYKELELPVEANRQAQIALARRNYMYMEGKQYLAPQWSSDGRSWDWAQVQVDDKNGKKRKFASVYNIIYADGIKFIAVVGQRPPNMKAVPEDPMLPEHVNLASDANTAALHLHKQWNIRRRMKEIAFYLWSTGPVFLHTKYVSDAVRYGTEEVPRLSTRPEVIQPAGIKCTNCGNVAMANDCPVCAFPLDPFYYQDAISVEVPYQDGVEVYPKGGVDLGIKTVFDVGTSFGARTLEECDWLTDDAMESRWKLMSMYGLSDEDLKPASNERGSVTDAHLAKEMIESPNGVATYDRANDMVLHSRKYLRPTVYHALAAEDRAIMQTQFPHGAYIVFCGDKIVQIEARNMDDYWAVCKTGTGPKISDPPLCNGIIPIQDDLNDFVNMGRETILRAIPKTFVDGSLLDPQALKENEALVGEIIRVKLGTNQSIGSLVQALPTAKMNEQMMPFGEFLRGYSREIDGVQPAIYGGGQPANTFRAENQRKNQALMQLQPPFEEMQEAVRVATRNGIKELARYGTGTVKVPSKDPMVPTRHLQLEALQETGWDIEAEESAPTTIGEKQERVASLSQENPDLAAALGFAHPMNVAEMQRMFGVDGLYTPGAMQLKKALATIQQLLQEQPIEDVDPMTGQPMQQPSQMPDPYEFKDAAFMSQVFHAWVLSDAGQQYAQQNPIGFENVKLFGGQLDQMAAPPMMPPPDAAGGPPPPPEGGAEQAPPEGGPLPPEPMPPTV